MRRKWGESRTAGGVGLVLQCLLERGEMFLGRTVTAGGSVSKVHHIYHGDFIANMSRLESTDFTYQHKTAVYTFCRFQR